MKIMNYNGAGIYGIKNKRTGKVYIGSSGCVSKRIKQHIKALQNGKHINKQMQKDFSGGDPFEPVLYKKIAVDVPEELFKAEGDVINRLKSEEVLLYNTLPMSGNYYTQKEVIIQHLADLFCREHFGMNLGQFFGRSEAAYNMYYKILLNPEDEASIRAKYEPAIEYQNKNAFYGRAGITYDDYLEMSEEEQKEINRIILRGGRHGNKRVI